MVRSEAVGAPGWCAVGSTELKVPLSRDLKKAIDTFGTSVVCGPEWVVEVEVAEDEYMSCWWCRVESVEGGVPVAGLVWLAVDAEDKCRVTAVGVDGDVDVVFRLAVPGC